VSSDLPAFGWCGWVIAALALKNPLKQHNLINERPKLSLSLLKPQLEGGLRVGMKITLIGWLPVNLLHI